jgi:hypothetical protein
MGVFERGSERHHLRLGVTEFTPATRNNQFQVAKVTHPTLQGVGKPATNVQILRIELKTRGQLNPLGVTGFTFGAKGTQANQISGAKVFSTGASATFNANTQLGTTLAAPTNNQFAFTFPNVSVGHGTHYF